MVNAYQYGIVHEIELSRHGLIQKVVIKYRNSSKNIDDFTTRAVCELVLIYPMHEIHIMEELGNIAMSSIADCGLNLVSVDEYFFFFVWECKVSRFTVLIKLLIRTIQLIMKIGVILTSMMSRNLNYQCFI